MQRSIRTTTGKQNFRRTRLNCVFFSFILFWLYFSSDCNRSLLITKLNVNQTDSANIFAIQFFSFHVHDCESNERRKQKPEKFTLKFSSNSHFKISTLNYYTSFSEHWIFTLCVVYRNSINQNDKRSRQIYGLFGRWTYIWSSNNNNKNWSKFQIKMQWTRVAHNVCNDNQQETTLFLSNRKFYFIFFLLFEIHFVLFFVSPNLFTFTFRLVNKYKNEFLAANELWIKIFHVYV